MKQLAIAPEPFFTPRGTPLSVYYRSMITAELGVQVDLLTYGQGADVDIPGVRVIRIPKFGRSTVEVGPSLFKAFLDIFIFLWALALMARNRYDIVHAHEETVFFCRLLKPIFRYKLVYDMHSILSQQLVNFSFTSSRLLIGTFRRLEDGCLAKADAVITISPALAEYAEPRVKDPANHYLIENTLFDEVRYFFYITNNRKLSASKIVFSANDRCNQENLNAQLKGGVFALRMPVDSLESNWAYMVIASLAWTLKSWTALLLPETGRWKAKYKSEKRNLLRMEFRTFLNSFMRVPCQIARQSRKIIYRLLSWTPWQSVLFRLMDALSTPLRC